jgi:Protein of unknown function (DUF3043)
VLFRRNQNPSPSPSADGSAATAGASKAPPGGKGRATPSRKEAEAARRDRAKPPLDRRAAARAGRLATREDRIKARQALVSGDERALPARDKGPVRRFARDYVDSRRTPGEFMLPAMVLLLPLTLGINVISNLAVRSYVVLATYLYMLTIMVGTTLMARRVKRQAAARFPDADLRGTGLYAAMRSVQPRRWRLPKARVKTGDPI